MIDVEIVDPTSDGRWEKLAVGPGGSLFVSPPWLRALRDTYSFDFRAAIVTEHGDAVSGFAWAETVDLHGPRAIALPFCDFADPILADPRHWPVLSEAVFAIGVPVTLRVLRPHAAVVGDSRLQRVK